MDRCDLLTLKRDWCNGCGICIEVCPKDSVKASPPVIENGRLLRFPVIDIDANTCILCGICAVLCPMRALESWVNDKKTAMFVENEEIPQMVRSIEVTQSACRPDCRVKCEESCPREAIEVTVKRKEGRVRKIVNVQVDTDPCIYCKVCEYACPYGAIYVNKFLEGTVTVDTEKCPERCQVCVDVCPSGAVTTSGGRVQISRQFCIYCKACQNLCPEGAIRVTISRVSHTPIKSATWITLLERFASHQAATKELAAKSTSKLRTNVRSRV